MGTSSLKSGLKLGVLVFLLMAMPALAGTGIRGDGNGDGYVRVHDITKVERVVASVDPVGDSAYELDANGDGAINVLDITATEILVATAP